ncbi:hypothetical protein, partial [Paenibacillus plantiphilus]|uniref:hypothetical protein n=1 Tax=Paenibacillus plantiphilus TaxID=2905650 RepID=UPI001F40EA04
MITITIKKSALIRHFFILYTPSKLDAKILHEHTLAGFALWKEPFRKPYRISPRPISIRQLHALLHFHPEPINL